MNTLPMFAQAFQYPYPGQMDNLHAQTKDLKETPGERALAKFVGKIVPLTLSEQEELFTRTLDLSPLTAPYVGYHVWGESYKRGEFMAALNKEMKDLGVDLDGELPDHLLPILRYLHTTTTPMPELLSILDHSLKSMIQSLKKGEEDNPYVNLFEALAFSFGAVQIEA